MVSKKMLGVCGTAVADGAAILYTWSSTNEVCSNLPLIRFTMDYYKKLPDGLASMCSNNYNWMKSIGASQEALDALKKNFDRLIIDAKSTSDYFEKNYTQTLNSINTNRYLVIPTLIALEAAIVTSPYWGSKLVRRIKNTDTYKRLKGKVEGHSLSVARKKARNQKPSDLEEGMLSHVLS